MTLLHHPRFSSWIRSHLLCRVERASDCFALTFDDGPSAAMTPKLLDLLRHHGAKATFFMLATHVRRHPRPVRRMVAEGHEPALHGDLHWPLPFMPRALLRREIERCAAAIHQASGARPIYYRPPFGFMTPAQSRFVAGLGYRSVLGDVYPEDPHRPGVDCIVARVMRRLVPGSIVILHDGSPFGDFDRAQTVAAVEIILERAAARGLRAVTVGELSNTTREA